MIMTNLYGTIVSNLACGLIGGPGLLSGKNIGPKVWFTKYEDYNQHITENISSVRCVRAGNT